MAVLRRFAHRFRLAIAASLLTMLGSTIPAVPVSATVTIVVNTTADMVHDSAGNTCVTAGGTCSLRDAVLYGNVHNVDTAITVPPGVYRLTIPPAGADDASTGDLNLLNNVTINGAGAGATTIDGSAITDGIFTNVDSNTMTLSGLTLNGGLRTNGAIPSGGALFMQNGTTIVTDCIFSNNAARGYPGVGTGNSHDGGLAFGGAIDNERGILDVRRSTFVNNSATGGAGAAPGGNGGSGYGGAISSYSMSVATSINNSTFANNVANGGSGSDGSYSPLAGGIGGLGTGGAVYLDGSNIPGSITGSTFVSNRAIGGIGGNGKANGDFGTGAGGQGGGSVGGAVATGTTASFSIDISNSTFASNTATGGKGGNGGSASPYTGAGGAGGSVDGGALSTNLTGNTITNVTIDGNNATGGIGGLGSGGTHGAPGAHTGGGISIYGGSTQVANTIVSNNGASGNCAVRGFGVLNNTARNLQFNPNSGCGSDTPFAVGDPKLGPLTYNGGPTQTRELLPGSAAIDVGNDTYCGSAPVSGLDQRGLPRPQGPHCDIGAFEVAHPSPQPTPKATAAVLGQPVAPKPNPPHLAAPTSLPFTPTPQPQPSRH